VDLRIGQGLDVHAFARGDHIMLGGVKIPHSKGVAAHSDGDVALHALCDALLGALALGDIGQHFPPGDDQFRDADSADLLADVYQMLARDGWTIVNLDLTIACEQPRITPHVASMRAVMASILQTSESAVSVKATTTEKLGFCGRGEGIAAMAVVLIQREK
jgi:2-C-methyl-D-erythritol 2,4-cyclodiphosphate synthase